MNHLYKKTTRIRKDFSKTFQTSDQRFFYSCPVSGMDRRILLLAQCTFGMTLPIELFTSLSPKRFAHAMTAFCRALKSPCDVNTKKVRFDLSLKDVSDRNRRRHFMLTISYLLKMYQFYKFLISFQQTISYLKLLQFLFCIFNVAIDRRNDLGKKEC